jgi:glycosyltransferase involved in cell wall biosynthesis
MSTSVAYFINQYPKVSHSFIRREIHALERQGCKVLRIALRGWADATPDSQDSLEKEKTRYVLKNGVAGLAVATLSALVAHPLRFARALSLALQLSKRADRSWPYHLVYLAEACRILPWLKEFGASHVHAHFGTNSTEVVMLAHALGGPAYSFTVHGPEEFDKPQFIALREKMEQAAFVVPISSYGRSQLYRWLDHAMWDKVHVVHCGLEAEFHQVVNESVPDVARLVCVGRLCEQKGQLLLVRALHQLAQRGVPCELVLAGDGEMRADLEQLIRQLGLQERVRITGWISSEQVRAELLASRALVLPSFAEGLPVVIMEAMALRRPVILTNWPMPCRPAWPLRSRRCR